MNLKRWPIMIFLLGILLAACRDEPAAVPPIVSTEENNVGETAVQPPGGAYETLADEQGAVSVAITPLGLRADAPTLDFEIAMDTHSVDLGMDLAALATLTTDNGRFVTATLWDAVPGGHHVSGVLSFPAMMEGTAVLEGASQLTLTIRDVDALERVFTWTLN